MRKGEAMKENDEIAALRARIDALEVRAAVQSLGISALLGTMRHQDADMLLCTMQAADARALYATSLSDDQLNRVLEAFQQQILDLFSPQAPT